VSGSGKTTFSRQLAAALDAPYIEMDALFWKPEWTESTDPELYDGDGQWCLASSAFRPVAFTQGGAAIFVWVSVAAAPDK
jgi:gluconate kinase